jgi:hypothetical protein
MPRSKSSKASSSIKSISKRIIVSKDNRDPVCFLASCLFYSIHVSNTNKLPTSLSLGSGAHIKLETIMYETISVLGNDSMGYMQNCYKLFIKHLGEIVRFDQFIELILCKFIDKRMLKHMRSENYSKYFESVLERAGRNYIKDLKSCTNTLYAYDSIDHYKDACVDMMHGKLVSAFEISSHLLVGDSGDDSVPLSVYEITRDDRNRLAAKYKKLKKQYRHVKRQLELEQ